MERIKLSKQAFKSAIGKGRGIVLQFLMQFPFLDNDYYNIVKWACTTFTNMNMQDDGANARYYYEIIELMPDKKEITDYIVKFLENGKIIVHYNDFDNAHKAFSILCLCARDDEELNRKAIEIYKSFYSKAELIVEKHEDGTSSTCENYYLTFVRFLFHEITGFDYENNGGAYIENFQMLSSILLDDIIKGKLFEMEDIFWQFDLSEKMSLCIEKLAKTDYRYKVIIDYFEKQKKEKKILTEEECVRIAEKKSKREKEKKDERASDIRQQLFDKHITDDAFLLAEILKAKSKEQIERLISYLIDSIEYMNKSSLIVLVALYEKAYCTNCRFKLVRIMNYFHVIPKYILEECCYDCNLELREYAREIMENRIED